MRRYAHAHWQVCRPYSSHGAEHFQRVAATVFQVAAVFISPHIGQGRDETGQQITVGTVQFQPVKACCNRVAGGLHKFGCHPIHLWTCHGAGRLVGWAKSYCAGGNQWPVPRG